MVFLFSASAVRAGTWITHLKHYDKIGSASRNKPSKGHFVDVKVTIPCSWLKLSDQVSHDCGFT